MLERLAAVKLEMIHALTAPRTLVAAAATVAALLVVFHDARLSLVLLPVVGFLLVIALSHWLSDDPWLPRLGVLNLVMGGLVCAGLYWLSGLGHPRLEPMVVKKGFWVFGLDAMHYHERALQIAYALRHRVLFPEMDLMYGGSFTAFLGVIYAGLGAHPLIAPAINVILLATSVLLVYRLAARFGTRAAARAAALAAALWPSALLWSSQVMKDTSCLFLTLLMIVLTVELLAGMRAHWAGRGLVGTGLFAASLLLYTLRFYVVIGFLVTTIAALALSSLRVRRLYARHAVVVGIIGLGVTVGWALGKNFLFLMLNPTGSPAAVLYREARELEAAARLTESRERYQASIVSKADFWPAYRKLGELEVRLGELRSAEQTFRRYLDIYPLDGSAPAIRNVIQRLSETNRLTPQPSSPPASGGTLVAATPIERPPAATSEPKAAGVAGEETPASVQPKTADESPKAQESVAATESDATPKPAAELAAQSQERVSPQDVKVEASKILAGVQCSEFRYCGGVTMADTKMLMSRLSSALTAASLPSLDAVGAIRNGYIGTGGNSVYTGELMTPDTNWSQWLKWSPRAFITMLGAPYPWQWHKAGRIEMTWMAMGLESLVLLVVFPFAAVASWRLAKSGAAGGFVVLSFFFIFGTVLGLTVVNVGSLVRLRLPLIFVVSVLAAVGMTSSRSATDRPSPM